MSDDEREARYPGRFTDQIRQRRQLEGELAVAEAEKILGAARARVTPTWLLKVERERLIDEIDQRLTRLNAVEKELGF